MKRGRIKRTSAKAAARNEVRADLIQAWLEESAATVGNYLGFAICEIRWDRQCTGRAIEGHEPRMRSRGGDILDRGNVFLTCRHCHDQVHRWPEEATARGFLVSRYGGT